MEIHDAQILEIYAKQCGHCLRSAFLPYDNERTSITCGYNAIKWKKELTKVQRDNKLCQ